MATTVTLIDRRREGHFLIERYKVAHTTGGGTANVPAGVTRAAFVLLNDGTTVTTPGATEYITLTSGDFVDTITVTNQADNSTRYVDLFYGPALTSDPAF
jgi:hypothetical protein